MIRGRTKSIAKSLTLTLGQKWSTQSFRWLLKLNQATLLKTYDARCKMNYWELVADKLSKSRLEFGLGLSD